MSTLLTLEGRRSGFGQIQRIKPKVVNSKGRRGVNMIAKPLTCAALCGSMHRYDVEMNGIGSFVKRQTKKVSKAAKTVSKAAVKITPKPLKKVTKAITYMPTKVVQNTAKTIGFAAKGQYASALKASNPVNLIPKSIANKVASKAKKTVVGRNIVKAASTVDKKVSKKINKEAKGVIVKAVTAAYGPAAGAATNKYLPEGTTTSKAATVVDQIVQSPVAQTPTVATVAQAEQIIESSPVTSETKSSSGVGIMATIAAAAMFIL